MDLFSSNASGSTLNPKFIFVGYSIRLNQGIHLDKHKPGSRVITVDRSLHYEHPKLDKPGWEHVGDYWNSETTMRYNIDAIKDIYSSISNKLDYSIFGYAIDINDILKYQDIPGSSAELFGGYGSPRFGYALINPIEPRGEFLGFDVMDYATGFSILSNCKWEIVEECGKLNDNNLFLDYESARCFRERAKDLEPVHAPYAIWAIYAVEL